MLFDILARLFSTSIITTAAYTLLGGQPMDAFIIYALMFLVVWPQEWAIDKIQKYISRRKDGKRKQTAPHRCRRCA